MDLRIAALHFIAVGRTASGPCSPASGGSSNRLCRAQCGNWKASSTYGCSTAAHARRGLTWAGKCFLGECRRGATAREQAVRRQGRGALPKYLRIAIFDSMVQPRIATPCWARSRRDEPGSDSHLRTTVSTAADQDAARRSTGHRLCVVKAQYMMVRRRSVLDRSAMVIVPASPSCSRTREVHAG